MKKQSVLYNVFFLFIALLITNCHSSTTPEPTNKLTRIAFICAGPISDNGWTYEHNQGRLFLEQHLRGIETTYIDSVSAGADSEKVIRD